jgi:hypothetical protein
LFECSQGEWIKDVDKICRKDKGGGGVNAASNGSSGEQGVMD